MKAQRCQRCKQLLSNGCGCIERTARSQEWNVLETAEKGRFLRIIGAPLGWEAHTWSRLPREIQAKFETR